MKNTLVERFNERFKYWKEQIDLSWDEYESLRADIPEKGISSIESTKRALCYNPKTIRKKRPEDFRREDLGRLCILLDEYSPYKENELFYNNFFHALNHYFQLENQENLKVSDLNSAIKDLERVFGSVDNLSNKGVLDKLSVANNLSFLVDNDFRAALSNLRKSGIQNIVRLQKKKEAYKLYNNKRTKSDVDCIILLWRLLNDWSDSHQGLNYDELEKLFFLNPKTYIVESAQRDSKRRAFIRTLIFHILYVLGYTSAAKSIIEIIQMSETYSPDPNSRFKADQTLNMFVEDVINDEINK